MWVLGAWVLGVVNVAVAVILAAPQTGANLAPTGTLRATFIANNPVQGRVDAQTGAVSGPGPDLVRELARRLGVPPVVTPLPNAEAVLESVTAGKADIGFLAYEAARAGQVDFSDPYLLSGSAYAVRADSPIRRSADVDRAGVTVG
ncbi:MAG: transporter substrate-binding domain-containing protein, partial [Acidobacteria bacterium]|nr:transporter substrate-binding domain-containing protein [Acidobacteriota bacterium]